MAGVKPRSRTRLFVLGGLLLLGCAFLGWRAAYVPEPKHLGIGLGTYLARWETNRLEPFEASRALGTNAVPYLVQELRRNLLGEFLMKLAPKVPATVRPIFPDPRKYLNRRAAAADLLADYPEALPAALEVLEHEEEWLLIPHCLIIVDFHARGSPHEERAVKALLGLSRHPNKYVRNPALVYLAKYKHRSGDVVPALVSGLYYPGVGPQLIDVLVKFGTNALPYLRVAAVSEAMTNVHVRPAAVALERIEQGLGRKDQTVVSRGR